MKKELLEKTLKKDLTESDLRTRLSVILGYDITDYGLVATFNAKRLEDLLKIEYNKLVHAERLGKIRCLKGIKRDVHLFGCTLKDEFKELNLTDEEALIPISALDISKRVQSILYRTGYIYVLGDLLSTPYNKLEQLRGIRAEIEAINETENNIEVAKEIYNVAEKYGTKIFSTSLYVGYLNFSKFSSVVLST
jgi:histone deacetylase complex regulatory component SIN3